MKTEGGALQHHACLLADLGPHSVYVYDDQGLGQQASSERDARLGSVKIMPVQPQSSLTQGHHRGAVAVYVRDGPTCTQALWGKRRTQHCQVVYHRIMFQLQRVGVLLQLPNKQLQGFSVHTHRPSQYCARQCRLLSGRHSCTVLQITQHI
jgi:hypothetical protein